MGVWGAWVKVGREGGKLERKWEFGRVFGNGAKWDVRVDQWLVLFVCACIIIVFWLSKILPAHWLRFSLNLYSIWF